MGLGDNNYY